MGLHASTLRDALDAEQRAKYDAFIKVLHTKLEAEDYEPDFCMTQPFHWKVRGTGIMTIIEVISGDMVCDLSIDDDGEMTHQDKGWKYEHPA